MTTYSLTYRLRKDGLYESRYIGLQRALAAYAAPERWSLPGSAMIFESEASIDDLAAVISGVIDTTEDAAVLQSADSTAARLIGKLDEPALLALIPNLREV